MKSIENAIQSACDLQPSCIKSRREEAKTWGSKRFTLQNRIMDIQSHKFEQ